MAEVLSAAAAVTEVGVDELTDGKRRSRRAVHGRRLAATYLTGRLGMSLREAGTAMSTSHKAVDYWIKSWRSDQDRRSNMVRLTVELGKLGRLVDSGGRTAARIARLAKRVRTNGLLSTAALMDQAVRSCAAEERSKR